MKIKLLNNDFFYELYDDIIKNKIIYFITLFSALVFFYILRNIALATHDDIQTYVLFRRYGFNEVFFNSIKESLRIGRIFQFTNSFTNYLAYVSNNIIIYKIIFNFYILFSIISLWYLIYKHINKTLALMVVFVYFSFAHINMQHNGFVSFPGSQASIGFIFLSIERLLTYYKNKKINNLIWSSIFLLIPTLLYETFILFSIMLFLISIIHYYKNNNILICILNSLKDLKFHIILMILYLIIYFIGRMNAETIYSGAEIKIDNISDSFYALLKYATGSFPLNTFRKIYNEINILSYINFLFILKAVLASIFICIILNKLVNENINNLKSLSLLAILGIFLPVVLISITPLHVNWAINHGVYTHLPSYYSYFFISVLLTIFCFIIYKKFKYKKIFNFFIIIIIFFGSLFTDVNNLYYAEKFNNLLNKYKALDKALSSEQFLNIESGAYIYIPDYNGIHNSINSFNDVLPKSNINKYNFLKNYEILLNDKPTYMLEYDENEKEISIKKLDNNEYIKTLWVDGFSTLESNDNYKWRWCDKNGKLEIHNVIENYIKIKLSGILVTQYNEYSTVTIKAKDIYQDIQVNSNGTSFEFITNITNGVNIIEFYTDDTKQVYAPNDDRTMYFNIRNEKIIIINN